MKKLFFILYSLFICAGARASALETIGDMMEVGLPAYAFGLSMGETGYEGARQFIYSYGAMRLSVAGLKSAIDEERPNKKNKDSFPSGHTASAFSAATFIHKRYGLRQAAAPYALAAITGYSRVESKWHHWHDVAAGAAIGAVFTLAFVGRYDVMVSGDTTGARVDAKMRF
ncbi:MAG: phosphatase PAP2 family protein [Rickettsiales bacterium]|jgi:membrane-associated phospholipid phosphatase|nr:phosphatase PAP2 family protein [Rickettsiales bacterium]